MVSEVDPHVKKLYSEFVSQDTFGWSRDELKEFLIRRLDTFKMNDEEIEVMLTAVAEKIEAVVVIQEQIEINRALENKQTTEDTEIRMFQRKGKPLT